ncbi:hypothetical protein CCR75_008233 [Bremia lactucae]|uniref:Protein kinase domain-containing protein n=1 Tax=Bremia lactucae TaxID=4779 RepID=A0A976FIK7_BRELC|nr:hypothetical protein CCR75_008233 [Bremia lactucae]
MLRCLSCFSRHGTTKDDNEPASSSAQLGFSRNNKKELKFESAYETLRQIGEGKTGQVFVAKKKRPHYRSRAKTLAEQQQREREERKCDEEVAVKFVRKEYLSTPKRIEALQSELAILKRVKHPGILRLRKVFEDEDKFVIVTDKATGGEVLNAICRSGNPRICECDVAEIIRQLLSVLAYLHLNGITHRDVKLENILCKTENFRGGVLLIDFGLAHMGTVGGTEMTGMNGTPHYMAPEMFHKNGSYGCAIDLWSLGVVTYILLFGQYPFDARFMSQVEDKIIKGEFKYPSELEPLVSPQAKKFIEYLLVLNPRERPPAAMALQHPWLQKDSSPAIPFRDEHVAALVSFCAGKHSFEPPAPTEYVPPEPIPKEGVVIYVA